MDTRRIWGPRVLLLEETHTEEPLGKQKLSSYGRGDSAKTQIRWIFGEQPRVPLSIAMAR